MKPSANAKGFFFALMKSCFGIDGSKNGWIIAKEEGGEITVREVRALNDLILELRKGIVAIDIPIGLADGPRRAADTAARSALAPKRKSSIFNSPARASLNFHSYPELNEFYKTRFGLGISKQSFYLMTKIREVDDLLKTFPDLKDSLFEVHPELAFQTFNQGALLFSKRENAGIEERTRLVALALATPFAQIQDTLRALPGVKPDDILDALINLHVAKRIREGIAQRYPEFEELDSLGLRMQIWA